MRRLALAWFILLPLGGCLLAGSGDDDDDGGACVPAVDTPVSDPDVDPACTSCVSRSCEAGPECSSECVDFYDCTCACDPEDTACFSECNDLRSNACEACEKASSDAFFACIEDSCGDVCFGGSAPPSGSGGSSTTGGDSGDDPSTPVPDGGACDTLFSECCPRLSGFDQSLCEDADGEVACQLWLDVFREDGAC